MSSVYNWIIGIATGIVSGVIVYFKTSKIIVRGRSNAYKSRVNIANKAVLDMLRPHIADLGIPDELVIKSAIGSVSRQYEIPHEHMSDINAVYEDLICEFIANLYIPKDVKTQGIKDLIERIQETIPKHNTHGISNSDINEFPQRKKISLELVSAIISLLSSITVACVYPALLSIQSVDKKDSLPFILAIYIIVVILLIAIIIFFVSKLNGGKRRNKHNASNIADMLYTDRIRDSMRMMNHGTSLSDLYDEPMQFIDYFEKHS